MAQQCAHVCLNCLCNVLGLGYIGRDFGHNMANTSTYAYVGHEAHLYCVR